LKALKKINDFKELPPLDLDLEKLDTCEGREELEI
jgi:hypothetical protein